MHGQHNIKKNVEFYSKKKIWEISASVWFYYKNEFYNTLSKVYTFQLMLAASYTVSDNDQNMELHKNSVKTSIQEKITSNWSCTFYGRSAPYLNILWRFSPSSVTLPDIRHSCFIH